MERLWRCCGEVAERLWRSCGGVAAQLRRSCGEVAARLRRGRGEVAAKLRRSCGEVAANLRRTCGEVVATTHMHKLAEISHDGCTNLSFSFAKTMKMISTAILRLFPLRPRRPPFCQFGEALCGDNLLKNVFK